MPTLYPDSKTELPEIKRAIRENGVTDPRALAMAITEFSEAKFGIEGVDAYMVLLNEKLTANPAGGDDGLGEHAEEIERAFAGRGNADARQRLLKVMTPEALDAAAKRFGLTGYTDFKGVGKLPADIKPKDKSASNPYSDGFAKTHTPDQVHAEIARLTRVMGTRAVSELAKAQGKTITGQVLRTRAA